MTGMGRNTNREFTGCDILSPLEELCPQSLGRSLRCGYRVSEQMRVKSQRLLPMKLRLFINRGISSMESRCDSSDKQFLRLRRESVALLSIREACEISIKCYALLISNEFQKVLEEHCRIGTRTYHPIEMIETGALMSRHTSLIVIAWSVLH
ncbi:hypothetical protein Tco_0238646 [Tanacetum coccineum]